MPALVRGVIPAAGRANTTGKPAKEVKFPQGLDHPASKEVFGPKLQGTFGKLGKQGVGAPTKLAPQSQQKYGYKTFSEAKAEKRPGHTFEIPVRTCGGSQ